MVKNDQSFYDVHPPDSAGWVARLRGVSEAALEVASELDLDRVLQRVVDTARELVNARYAALGVARPDLSGLSRFVVSGISQEETRAMAHWPRGLGLLGVLLREPRPLRVRRIQEDPRSVGFPPNHPPMTSFLGVPIRMGDRILGNFYLTDKQGLEEFSQEDEDIMVLFASHAAVAVENARRYTEVSERLSQSLLEIQRAEQRSRFLAELSALLPIGPIVDQIPWEMVANRCTELLGDAAAIYLMDLEEPTVALNQVVRHTNPARVEAVRRFLQGSWGNIIDQVIADRSTLLVARSNSLDAQRGRLDLDLMRREKLSAAIVVPIKTEQRVYGVFASLGSQPIQFSEDDLTFASLIADRLGIAMENAELIRQLRAALQARDEFVSIATHELKTPATVLRGYAQALLAQRSEWSERERRALVAIDRQSGRLADLVNDLLDVSRLRVGRLELNPERVDLVALCRDVMDRFVLLMEGNGDSRLRLQAPEPSIWGSWDRSRVDQVLTNLISNALKYSPLGEEVLLVVERADLEASVSVTDHGIGIPADQQPYIFEPFRRARNALAGRIEGAGLGLHISREIVERHGGRMGFDSEEGRGSRFYFTLPLEAGQRS